MTTWRRLRRLVYTGLLGAAVIAPLAAFRAPAAMHLRLLSSDPAADTSLAAAPQKIRLTFSEAVTVRLSSIALMDGAGKPVAVERAHGVTGSAAVLETAIKGKLSPGAYQIKWKAVGDDGHVVRGKFGFKVGAAPAAPKTAAKATGQSLQHQHH